jgi:small subunit ribosomal protein S17
MRTKTGIVTSAKMTGTVTVTVHESVFHPIYKKRFRKSRKFLADLNGHTVHEGDLITIAECKPLSKNKYFKVQEIVQKAPQVSEIAEEAALEKTVHREKHAPDEKASEEKKEDTSDSAK